MLNPGGPRRSLALLFGVILIGLACIPLSLTAIPPFNDYPNHLARAYFIAHAESDRALSAYYFVDWKLVPNLAIDVIVPALSSFMDTYTAGSVFVLAMLGMLVLGPHALHYALYRRFSLGPMVATLFLYNAMQYFGIVNYFFGVGLALFGAAAWILARDRSRVARASLSLAFIIALFFCHLVAVGVYGLTLLSYEAWKWSQTRNWHARLLDLVTFGLPFAIVPAILFLGSPDGDAGPRFDVSWSLAWKARGPWYVLKSSWPVLDVTFGLLLSGALFWVWRRRWVHFHPSFPILAGLAITTHLLLPLEAMSAWGIDVRFPAAMVFVCAGYLDCRFPTRASYVTFCVGLLGLALLRFGGVAANFLQRDALRREMVPSFEMLAPGSRVFVAAARPPGASTLQFQTYLPCLAIIERSTLCSIAFAHPRQQVLGVRPPYREWTALAEAPPPLSELILIPARSAHSQDGRVYWRSWRDQYDYLYLLQTAPDDANPLPHDLRLLFTGKHFQLFQILKRR